MAVDGSLDAFKREYTDFLQELNAVTETVVPHVQHLEELAGQVKRNGEMIAIKRIDQQTIGENRDLADTLSAAMAAAQNVSGAANDAQKATRAAHDQLQTSGGGIQEAARRSPVDVSEVDPSWFEAD